MHYTQVFFHGWWMSEEFETYGALVRFLPGDFADVRTNAQTVDSSSCTVGTGTAFLRCEPSDETTKSLAWPNSSHIQGTQVSVYSLWCECAGGPSGVQPDWKSYRTEGTRAFLLCVSVGAEPDCWDDRSFAPHCEHWKSSSPRSKWWRRWWRARSESLTNPLPHSEHLCGRSPSWTYRTCFLRPAAWVNVFKHKLHVWETPEMNKYNIKYYNKLNINDYFND